jgi:lipopolysaccharide transport system ATP-binding protein
VKNYSSGMYVRLGFSIAINVDPDILVVDEVLAVGDSEFQQKCFAKFRDFKKAGKTVILVSHDMNSVKSMCDHAAWLNHGDLVAVGKAEPTIKAYLDSVASPPA